MIRDWEGLVVATIAQAVLTMSMEQVEAIVIIWGVRLAGSKRHWIL